MTKFCLCLLVILRVRSEIAPKLGWLFSCIQIGNHRVWKENIQFDYLWFICVDLWEIRRLSLQNCYLYWLLTLYLNFCFNFVSLLFLNTFLFIPPNFFCLTDQIAGQLVNTVYSLNCGFSLFTIFKWILVILIVIWHKVINICDKVSLVSSLLLNFIINWRIRIKPKIWFS